MLQAYSLNLTVPAESNVQFDNVCLNKCNNSKLSGPSSIELNVCGVYKVSVDATASASTTLQLYKDGVAMPQAQSTGTSLHFDTYVQVPKNNCGCPCSSPTIIKLFNSTEVTFTNVNMVIRKEA